MYISELQTVTQPIFILWIWTLFNKSFNFDIAEFWQFCNETLDFTVSHSQLNLDFIHILLILENSCEFVLMSLTLKNFLNFYFIMNQYWHIFPTKNNRIKICTSSVQYMVDLKAVSLTFWRDFCPKHKQLFFGWTLCLTVKYWNIFVTNFKKKHQL